MAKIRFLYVSRNQNRSGHAILRSLISSGLAPAGVLLPPPQLPTEWPPGMWLQKKAYQAQSYIENSKPLRFLESELILAKKASIPIVRAARLDSGGPLFREIWKSRYDLIFLGGGWPGRLPKDFLGLARLGALNTHPSLLPDFRGTSITRWQVLEGVSESGVTIHLVDEDFDSGPIVAQSTLRTAPNESPQELFQRLSELGANLAVEVLKGIERTGELPVLKQPTNRGRYYSKWNWDAANLEIDFSQSLKQVHQLVLANTQESYKFGGPTARFNNRVFFLRETELIRVKDGQKQNLAPGRFVSAAFGIEGFLLLRKPGDLDCLLIKKIQPGPSHNGCKRADRPIKFFSRHERVLLGE